MDQPMGKVQVEYQVLSVFETLAVFSTLNTEGTVNLRDAHSHGGQVAATA